jgi:MFS family permease
MEIRPRERWPFVAVTGALFTLMMSTNLPAGLYTLYRARFGFGSLTLTLVFATSAVVLIPSLIVCGQLSDRFGRPRVLLGGLTVMIVALVLLALARDTWWLFLARGLQGLAIGASTGTATAALAELEPSGDHGRAAIAALAGTAGGSAAGPILAGTLAQYAPWPRVLCYLIGITLAVAATVVIARIPGAGSRGGRWRPQPPNVPRGTRAAFARAGLTVAVAWGVGGLYVSVVPTYAAELLRTGNLAVVATVASTMLAAACAVQLVCLRTPLGEIPAQIIGLGALAASCVALILAAPAHSMAVLLTAALLGGAGLGLGFYGAQTQINRIAPADRRGEVTAAFVVCLYLGVTVVAVSVGLLSAEVSFDAAVAVVGAVTAATAVAAAVAHAVAGRRAAPPRLAAVLDSPPG